MLGNIFSIFYYLVSTFFLFIVMFANICLPEIRFIIVQLFTIIRMSIYVLLFIQCCK
uniref:Uncharacterized protein n=1 Tax=Papilio xuthus TaxID=66420 RepID=I4DLN8_PAPXU|nr:unknown unsecreted protein [Papilio xuthus]